MAKSNEFTYPLDQPAILEQGVSYRETDFHGNIKHLTLDIDDPIRQAKGDVGWNGAPAPRALSGGGVPWRDMKGDK